MLLYRPPRSRRCASSATTEPARRRTSRRSTPTARFRRTTRPRVVLLAPGDDACRPTTSDRDAASSAGVLNRHAACADCHQPHNADGSRPVDTTAAGRLRRAHQGASGVARRERRRRYAPDVHLATQTSAFEYQLCFKCHSGYTQLKPQAGRPVRPGRWTRASSSTRPTSPTTRSRRRARTTTPQMDRQPVAGRSPYKLWTFTPTRRSGA